MNSFARLLASRIGRHYALGVLTAVYVFNFLDRQLLAILLEPIQNEFGVSNTAMGFLYGFAFALFYATLAVPVAHLADRSNRRNVLAWASALWSGMTMLCGLATNYWQLLMFRVGVAVGEAGGVPPAQSMINDLYPPERRGMAMAVFSSATFIGTLLALVGGAILAQNYSWRVAFVVVGAPGLLLALIVRWTIAEPVRGAFDTPPTAPDTPPTAADTPPAGTDAGAQDKQASLMDALIYIGQVPSLKYMMGAAALAGMAGYGLGLWAPTFLIRVHGSSIVEAGVFIGGLGASVGLIGTLFGGWLCDKLATKGRRWFLYTAALSLLLSLPAILLFLIFPESIRFQVGNWQIPVAVLFFIFASFVGGWWAAPTYVAVQESVTPERRTLVCGVLLLVLNLIGFGVGPVMVGAFADLLDPSFGEKSLRYALMAAMSIYAPAIWLYFKAGRLFQDQTEGVSAS